MTRIFYDKTLAING